MTSIPTRSAWTEVKRRCGSWVAWAAWVATVVAAVSAGWATPLAAQEQAGLPAGKYGMSFGVRQGVGSLGDDFGLGAVGAVEAGFHPSAFDGDISLGLHWSVVWGWFGFDDQASVTGSLKLLEFNFGGRLRRAMSEGTPRFFWLGTGVTLLRSNVPIPPDLERVYVGPYAALGVEQFLSRTFIVSFEARYGLIVGGPGGISLALGIAFGR